ncbi:MAG TPA: hypothetical protein DEB70_08415 [Planctomycetaceae bacterium]|nr:hypothetical protein [Planctomycetaceae bacterium]
MFSQLLTHSFLYEYDMNAIENDYMLAWPCTNSICRTAHNAGTLWQPKTIASFETHQNECKKHLFL